MLARQAVLASLHLPLQAGMVTIAMERAKGLVQVWGTHRIARGRRHRSRDRRRCRRFRLWALDLVRSAVRGIGRTLDRSKGAITPLGLPLGGMWGEGGPGGCPFPSDRHRRRGRHLLFLSDSQTRIRAHISAHIDFRILMLLSETLELETPMAGIAPTRLRLADLRRIDCLDKVALGLDCKCSPNGTRRARRTVSFRRIRYRHRRPRRGEGRVRARGRRLALSVAEVEVRGTD